MVIRAGLLTMVHVFAAAWGIARWMQLVCSASSSPSLLLILFSLISFLSIISGHTLLRIVSLVLQSAIAAWDCRITCIVPPPLCRFRMLYSGGFAPGTPPAKSPPPLRRSAGAQESEVIRAILCAGSALYHNPR